MIARNVAFDLLMIIEMGFPTVPMGERYRTRASVM